MIGFPNRVYTIVGEQGWGDDTLLSLVAQYVDEEKLHASFIRFLEGRAAHAGGKETVRTTMTRKSDVGELVEALDNVTASLESCLACYGGGMTTADRRGRERVARTARKLVERYRPRAESEDDDEA